MTIFAFLLITIWLSSLIGWAVTIFLRTRPPVRERISWVLAALGFVMFVVVTVIDKNG